MKHEKPFYKTLCILAFWASALLLTACGSKRIDPKPPQTPVPERLQAQIDRIEPQLLYCESMPAFNRPHPLSQRGSCDTGDGMLWSGLMLSANPSNKNAILEAIRYSVDSTGRPWRSPENRNYGEHPNSFSRDMFFGLLMYLVDQKDQELALRFYEYLRDNDYNTCPKDSDGRCFLVPAAMELLGDVFKYIGLERRSDMLSLGSISEEFLELEVTINPPGFQLHLISMTVWLKVLTGNLRATHAGVAKALYERQNKNLWFRYLANLTNEGSQDEYDAIAGELTLKMEKWPGDFRNAWAWNDAQDRTSFTHPAGHEYVWLALLLGRKL